MVRKLEILLYCYIILTAHFMLKATATADVEHMGFSNTYIYLTWMQRRREDVLKKIYGQTYKTLFWSSSLILTIFTIVCGTFFIHLFSSLYLCTFMPAFSSLFKFDFVLKKKGKTWKKSFTGRLLYDFFFPLSSFIFDLGWFQSCGSSVSSFHLSAMQRVSHACCFMHPPLHSYVWCCWSHIL